MREVKEEVRDERRARADGDGAGAALDAPAREAARHPDAPRPAAGKGTPHPLVELTRSRLREFLREPEAVFWVFVFPVLLAFALGIAFRNTAPDKVRVAVETEGPGAARAAALAESLRRSPDLHVLTLPTEESRQALRSGRVALVVRPQDGPAAGGASQSNDTTAPDSSRTTGGARPSYEYRFDPTRPDSRTARLYVDDALQRASGRVDVAAADDVKVTEPGARYIDFLIPGLLGLNLMGSGLWGVGFAIVTARMRKLLKRLAATPMRRSHYLASFVLSRLIFLTLEVACVLVFAWLVFGYAVRGSLALMSLLLLVGAFTFAGVGLFISSRATTIEGVSGLMNLVMIPMWLFSGTFFSSERFPAFLQPFVKALPLTALNDSLRAVMNEGLSFGSVWPAVLILLAWCVAGFLLALKFFRWQ